MDKAAKKPGIFSSRIAIVSVVSLSGFVGYITATDNPTDTMLSLGLLSRLDFHTHLVLDYPEGTVELSVGDVKNMPAAGVPQYGVIRYKTSDGYAVTAGEKATTAVPPKAILEGSTVTARLLPVTVQKGMPAQYCEVAALLPRWFPLYRYYAGEVVKTGKFENLQVSNEKQFDMLVDVIRNGMPTITADQLRDLIRAEGIKDPSRFTFQGMPDEAHSRYGLGWTLNWDYCKDYQFPEM